MVIDPHSNRLRRLEFRPVSYDVDELVDLLEYAECDMIVMSATIGTGHALFPSRIMPHHPDMDPDYVPRVVEQCHQRDIAVTSWVVFNIQDVRSADDYAPAQKWPDMQIKFLPALDGTTIDGPVGMCLLGSPYWEILAEFQTEVLDLDVDALWFDGYSLRGMPGEFRPGCVCDHCARAFREDSGLDLPEREDWHDERFLTWVDWRWDRLMANTEKIVERVHAHRPGVPMTLNTANHPWDAPGWKQQWEWGGPMRRYRNVYTSHHAGTYDFNGSNLAMLNAKLAKAQSDEGADIWTPLWSGRESRAGSPRPRHLANHGLAAITEGVWPWWGMAHGSDQSLAETQPLYRWTALKQANQVVKAREPWFGGDELEFVGIVASEHTVNFYDRARDGSHNYDDHSSGLFGTHAMLSEAHLLHRILYEDHLRERDFGDCQVVILSNAACLDDDCCDALRGFVDSGGLLIAGYESTLCDAHGARRDDFALADVFGASWRDSITPQRQRDVSRGLIMVDPSLTGGVEHICIGARHCLIDPAAGAEVLAVSDPFGGNAGDEPAIVTNSFGSGEAIYFAEDFGVGYWSRPYTWTRDLLAGLSLRRTPPVQVDGPSVLHINALQADGELRVHLLNLPFATNRMMNRNAMATVEEVVPLHDVVVRVNLGAFSSADGEPFTSARAAIADLDLSVVPDGDSLLITVPRVEEHEILVLR